MSYLISLNDLTKPTDGEYYCSFNPVSALLKYRFEKDILSSYLYIDPTISIKKCNRKTSI